MDVATDALDFDRFVAMGCPGLGHCAVAFGLRAVRRTGGSGVVLSTPGHRYRELPDVDAELSVEGWIDGKARPYYHLRLARPQRAAGCESELRER